MIDVLRRWAPLLTMIALLWITLDVLQGEPIASASEGPTGPMDVLLPIPRDGIALRFPGEALPPLRDPFAVVFPEFVRPAPPPVDDVPSADASQVTDGPAAPTYSPSFELELESVMVFGQGLGTARINGRTLAVGHQVMGVDDASPPRLMAVQGTSALVRHRGRDLFLDLALARRIVIGPELIPAEEGAGTDRPDGAPK